MNNKQINKYTERIEESTKRLDISSKKLDKLNSEKINYPILNWIGRFINGTKGH